MFESTVSGTPPVRARAIPLPQPMPAQSTTPARTKNGAITAAAKMKRSAAMS